MINIESPVPGIYENVSFEDYLKIDAVSNSYLSRLAITPAHARCPIDDSDSKSLGRLIHTLVLEGSDIFQNRYVIAPKVDRRTKVGKAEWAEFIEENANKYVITQEESDLVHEINEGLLLHPYTKDMLSDGIVETTFIWRDERTGLLLKARPDVLNGTMIDVKSTRNAESKAFMRAINQYGYHRQNQLYMNGAEVLLPGEFDRFKFIAVEAKKPFRTEVYEIGTQRLIEAQQEIDELLDLELSCCIADHWPNYTQDMDGGYCTVLDNDIFYR